jgi:Kef-type K+ transport system membrane component KefB
MDPSLAVALVLVGAAGIALEIGFSSAIAEIAAGIMLALFYADIASLDWLHFLSNLGLLGLMFMAGFEVDVDRLRTTWRASTGIGIVSLGAPMTGVFLVCRFLLGLDGTQAALLSIGLSTTSLALVYHALKARGDLDGDFGQTVLGAATVVDILSMVCLAVLLGNLGWGTAIFLLVLIPTVFGLPRIGKWVFRRYHGSIVEFELRFLMVLLISMGFMAEHIGGIHPAIIAFLLGLIMAEVVEEHAEVEEKLKGVVFSLFAPIFFLHAGTRLDITAFSGEMLATFAMLFVTSIDPKFAATPLATRCFLGHSSRFVAPLSNYHLRLGLLTATPPRMEEVEAEVAATLVVFTEGEPRDDVVALGHLALAGRDVSGYVDRLDQIQGDTELLDAPVRLSIDPESEEWFQPRAVAFAVAALTLTGAVERTDGVRSIVSAHERQYAEFDAERRTITAVREVGWAFASVAIYTDGYLDVIVGLTERDDDTVRRVGAAALSDVAEEYAPIRGTYPDETPRHVAVAAGLLASDPRPRVRYYGAFALYEFALGRPELVRSRSDVLEAALSDDEELVRKDAAGALGLVGATEAIPALRDLAESDPAERVRNAAAEALESLVDRS